MFTGIVETMGSVDKILIDGGNRSFWISSSITQQLKVDQSLSHNGVCLTIEEIDGNFYKVTAIEETLKKTNLEMLEKGTLVNLERCMKMNGRIDGHIVQGHVDTTATCLEAIQLEGSWEYKFSFSEKFKHLVIEKGSICLNGTSLTIFNITDTTFTVAIIPYTYEHTNLNQVTNGWMVNLEFDMIGKYVQRFLSTQS